MSRTLFDYSDYREYLKDFYATQKQRNSSYSYRMFAKRAQLASPNYLKLVIDGSRRITDKNLASFIRGLKLTPPEAEYFRNLVYQREASGTESQAAFRRESERLRDLFFKRAKEIHQSKLEILKSWRHWAIREMVLLKDFRADPEWISSRLKPKVTPAQAGESLKLLEELEFIKKNKSGRFEMSEPLITTSDEVPSQTLRDLHRQFIELGVASLSQDSISERETSGLTIALSRRRVQELKAAIKTFRQTVNRTFSAAEPGELDKSDGVDSEVYHLIVNLFPLTNVQGGRV